tara:strand:- start:3674 stop:4756 length:1083 start_codon:yes stop_codon:yes gene_type:complete
VKLLLLSDPTSIHTKKWIAALSQKNIEIAVFGLDLYRNDIYDEFNGVSVFSGGNSVKSSFVGKLSYLNVLSALKKVYSEFRPDIVHAHYATSYGLLGGMLKHSPYIISVWGSDIYDFPQRSFLHKMILKRNFSKADLILSTGHKMAAETKKYTNKTISVTPFGIDTDLFIPNKNKGKDDKIIIGTVKSLEEVYGIDYLIKAFKILVKNNPNRQLELIIAGDGSLENELKILVKKLDLEKEVRFVGRVNHNEVVDVLNQFDIYVALSNMESFGVAILEASACEIPVVVSDTDGFKEVVEDGVTGLMVERKNPDAAAGSIQKLIDDIELRKMIGRAGRKAVLEHYNWVENVQEMVNIYDKIV